MYAYGGKINQVGTLGCITDTEKEIGITASFLNDLVKTGEEEQGLGNECNYPGIP